MLERFVSNSSVLASLCWPRRLHDVCGEAKPLPSNVNPNSWISEKSSKMHFNVDVFLVEVVLFTNDTISLKGTSVRYH